jgi:hypothetical protein
LFPGKGAGDSFLMALACLAFVCEVLLNCLARCPCVENN